MEFRYLKQQILWFVGRAGFYAETKFESTQARPVPFHSEEDTECVPSVNVDELVFWSYQAGLSYYNVPDDPLCIREENFCRNKIFPWSNNITLLSCSYLVFFHSFLHVPAC
jgi:hypothetical protein